MSKREIKIFVMHFQNLKLLKMIVKTPSMTLERNK